MGCHLKVNKHNMPLIDCFCIRWFLLCSVPIYLSAISWNVDNLCIIHCYSYYFTGDGYRSQLHHVLVHNRQLCPDNHNSRSSQGRRVYCKSCSFFFWLSINYSLKPLMCFSSELLEHKYLTAFLFYCPFRPWVLLSWEASKCMLLTSLDWWSTHLAVSGIPMQSTHRRKCCERLHLMKSRIPTSSTRVSTR